MKRSSYEFIALLAALYFPQTAQAIHIPEGTPKGLYTFHPADPASVSASQHEDDDLSSPDDNGGGKWIKLKDVNTSPRDTPLLPPSQTLNPTSWTCRPQPGDQQEQQPAAPAPMLEGLLNQLTDIEGDMVPAPAPAAAGTSAAAVVEVDPRDAENAAHIWRVRCLQEALPRGPGCLAAVYGSAVWFTCDLDGNDNEKPEAEEGDGGEDEDEAQGTAGRQQGRICGSWFVDEAEEVLSGKCGTKAAGLVVAGDDGEKRPSVVWGKVGVGLDFGLGELEGRGLKPVEGKDAARGKAGGDRTIELR